MSRASYIAFITLRVSEVHPMDNLFNERGHSYECMSGIAVVRPSTCTSLVQCYLRPLMNWTEQLEGRGFETRRELRGRVSRIAQCKGDRLTVRVCRLHSY